MLAEVILILPSDASPKEDPVYGRRSNVPFAAAADQFCANEDAVNAAPSW